MAEGAPLQTAWTPPLSSCLAAEPCHMWLSPAAAPTRLQAQVCAMVQPFKHTRASNTDTRPCAVSSERGGGKRRERKQGVSSG